MQNRSDQIHYLMKLWTKQIGNLYQPCDLKLNLWLFHFKYVRRVRPTPYTA